jgi:hypothetical protein
MRRHGAGGPTTGPAEGPVNIGPALPSELKNEWLATGDSIGKVMNTITDDIQAKTDAQSQALMGPPLAATSAYEEWHGEVNKLLTEAAPSWAGMMTDVFTQFSDGIGQAVAQTIIFGEDLLSNMKRILRMIGAQIIATLISVMIQQIIIQRVLMALMNTTALRIIGTMAARTWAAVYTSVVERLPFPVNYILAPVFATLAAGAMLAGSIAYLAEGGIVTGPTLGVIGESGPEAVIPLDRAGGLLGGGQTIIIELDGQVLATSVVEHAPGVLRVQGVGS